MFIEDYIPFISGSIYKSGSSKTIKGFSFLLHEAAADDFFHSNPDTYLKGTIVLDGHKVVTFRSYIGNKGKNVDLVCHGEFDRYSFWDYEDLEDEGTLKLKSKIPGSAHVKLYGDSARNKIRLAEFLNQLIEYSNVLKKRRAR